jgi:hypothetical protein
MTAVGKILQHLLIVVWISAACAHAEDGADRASMILVVGAGGEERYADAFAKWAAKWKQAAEAGGVKLATIGLEQSGEPDRQRLKSLLEAEPREGSNELWVVLLGHGTSDGKEAKFNLRGDDLATTELVEWLKPIKRTTVVVCAFSASGAWLKPLAAPGRVVVTATRSGSENNYARFGGYLAQAIADPAADMDKDGETSLLEAWLVASRKTADFYKEEGRLATEHSLLDDNGDGLGTPADWFRGVRAVKKTKDGVLPDGVRAAQIHLLRSSAERALSSDQRAGRDALERELAALRERKGGMKEDDYYRELEAILLKLARIYREGS